MRVPIRLPAKHKYSNQPIEVDGYRFASKREAKRYQELKILQQAGQIDKLEADKKKLRWPLEVNGTVICHYEADFEYNERFGSLVWDHVVEDCKGLKTPVYRIKKRLMKAIWGIEIKEV